MSNILFLDPGTSQTFEAVAFWPVSSGQSSSAAVVHGQPRALRVPVTQQAGAGNFGDQQNGRVSLYANFDTLATGYLWGVTNSGIYEVFGVRLSAAGKLQIFNKAVQISGDGATTINADTWYRMALCFTVTDNATNEVRLYLQPDGGSVTLELSVSNATLSGTNRGNHIVLCSGSSISGDNVVGGYFSDVYYDDDSSLADPGDVRVTAKLPSAHGVNSFTANVGANPANRWTNVNQRALSETDGWIDTGGNHSETYGVEAVSAGDVDITGYTILGIGGWIWAKAGTGGAAQICLDNGNFFGITVTTSPALYQKYLVQATYPTGLQQIGMANPNSLSTTLYECGIMIAYLQPAADFRRVIFGPRS